MIDTTLAPLAGWENFYVIVGSSAAALTGLQFVVIALVAEMHQRSTSGTIDAFATPTVVHFCVALLISATLSAPWPRLGSPAVVLGLTGVAGLAYAGVVIRRTLRQTGYKPVFEDWLWHSAMPILAYGVIVVASVLLPSHSSTALFFIAAASLLLVLIGIHNAWDTVTFITLTRLAPEGAASPVEAPRTPVEVPSSTK